MPAADLLSAFDTHLQIENRWLLPGTHYQRTAEAWLTNLDRSHLEAKRLFDSAYGHQQGEIWLERWRVFFMACAELFGTDSGSQWQVAHYLLGLRQQT